MTNLEEIKRGTVCKLYMSGVEFFVIALGERIEGLEVLVDESGSTYHVIRHRVRPTTSTRSEDLIQQWINARKKGGVANAVAEVGRRQEDPAGAPSEGPVSLGTGGGFVQRDDAPASGVQQGACFGAFAQNAGVQIGLAIG